MKMGLGRSAVVVVSGVLALAWVGGIASSAAVAARAGEAGDRLSTTIRHAIRAEGPFFTPAEMAVINRKCGYAPGEWDGFEVNINDDGFRCKNGKRVDDPEMRALLRGAQPRIADRVERAMARADVRAAIQRLSEDATRRALASIDHARIAREATRAAREAMEQTRLEMRRR
jgi:hypothetical protein